MPDPGTVPAGSSAPAGIVFGVDVVALSRAQQLLDRYGAAIGERVAIPEEAAWIFAGPDSAIRLGALLGMKEASIKAMGGRPEPFRWQHISTSAGDLTATFRVPPVIQPGGWPPAVTEVLRGFGAGMGLAELTTAGCAVHGPGLDRVTQQLPGAGTVRGAGCFGVRLEHVFAAVCFWKDENDE